MAGNFGSSRNNDEEMRIVMVGKPGIGKSATGNTILGRRCIEPTFMGKSMTVDCSKGKTTVDGQQYAVIDTPGLFDTRFGVDKTTKDMTQCITYAAPGPHVFLVVIRLDRYNEEEKQTVQRIQEMFGQAADRYSMVLFTHGDLLEDSIEDFLEDCSELQELVGRCNGQYHVFNNQLKDRSQVTKLLQKIRKLVQSNGGRHYTNEMFEEAERVVEEEKQRILKEKEEEIPKEKEEVERKVEEKYEKAMQKMNEQFQAERERERKERQEEMNREKECMNEDRKREREEREAERKRDREEKAAGSSPLFNPNMARNFGSSRNNDEEMRIVMVGKTGIGKSAAGNTILGRSCFESKFSGKSMTVDCSKGKTTVDGQQVAVIDTPGLFDTRCDVDKTTKDMTQCITYASPGPHVFLVVIRLGRYTEEEKQTVQRIQEIFGQAADRYSMVLFTHGDQLKDSIEDFLEDCPDLQELVDRCNGQYHVFNNELKDHSQVTELLQKIRKLVQSNGGRHYTNKMFEEAERVVEEEKQCILKEKEEEIRKEKEELERKVQEKYEKMMQNMNEQFQAERERERKERQEEMKRERECMNEERKREKEEREEEIKRESECMNEDKKREMKERQEEMKREKECMNEERKREREEREAERKRDREEKDREMANMKNEMEKQYQEELSTGREQVQSKHETKARKEAEEFNPLYPLVVVGELVVKGGGAVVDGIKNVGRAFWNLF